MLQSSAKQESYDEPFFVQQDADVADRVHIDVKIGLSSVCILTYIFF